MDAARAWESKRKGPPLTPSPPVCSACFLFIIPGGLRFLTGQLPRELAFLTRLKTLVVCDNFLEGARLGRGGKGGGVAQKREDAASFVCSVVGLFTELFFFYV